MSTSAERQSMLCLGCFWYSIKHGGTRPTLLNAVFVEGEPSTTYIHVGWGRSLAAAFSVFRYAVAPCAEAVCWVLWVGFVEPALFAWGISNSQQLSASAWCWVILATRLDKQEEQWGSAGTKAAFPAFSLFPAGEIVAAPSLSFLSSAPAAGCLQPTRFAFPLQSPGPTFPQLLLSFPRSCRSSPVTVSFSSYRALHSCYPFPNVFLFSPVFRRFCFLQGGCYAILAQELLLPALVSCHMLLPMFLPTLL